MYYINCFFLYSFIGFIIEFFILHKTNSGILYGPITIVYGIGFIIINEIHNHITKNNKINKKSKILFLFLLSSIFLTIIELIGGIFIEKVFHKTMWDYTKLPFNIGKYISLEISIIWGIYSIITIYIIKPLIDKIIIKIPKIITYTLSILFIVDVILTIINPNI